MNGENLDKCKLGCILVFKLYLSRDWHEVRVCGGVPLNRDQGVLWISYIVVALAVPHW